MKGDELFKNAHKFQMDEATKIGVLRQLNATPSVSVRRPPRRWFSGVLAGTAAVFVLIGASVLIKQHHIQNPAESKLTTTTTADITHSVKPSSVQTRSDSAVVYTYTGKHFLPGVKKYANFAVRVPSMSITSKTFTRFPSNKNKNYPTPKYLRAYVQIDGYVENESVLIQEMKAVKGLSTPFDDLVGSGKGSLSSEGKPQRVQRDGVTVRVGWPSSNSAHCYQFTKNGTVYFIKSTWNHPYAPPARDDKAAWALVRELAEGKSVN